MAQKVDYNMPGAQVIGPGWTVRVTAVDGTGATVTAVKVSGVIIDGASNSAPGQLEPVPPLLVNAPPPG